MLLFLLRLRILRLRYENNTFEYYNKSSEDNRQLFIAVLPVTLKNPIVLLGARLMKTTQLDTMSLNDFYGQYRVLN